MPVTRRSLLAAAAAFPAVSASAAGDPFAALESKSGGRLGVAVLDTHSGRRLTHRADERFALCSTFKFLLSAAVLARIDAGREHADRVIAYGQSDLVAYSPVTEKHIGGMTIGALTDAVLAVSDNTAANLLLTQIGGPAGWTQFARSVGDTVSRLDRMEPELNAVENGDERDTTTPAAMLGDLKAVMLANVLHAESRSLLESGMRRSTVGAKRLRAGVPPTWLVADKTGTGPKGRNDIALMRPPGRAPILACVYTFDMRLPPDEADSVIADIGRLIAQWVYPQLMRKR